MTAPAKLCIVAAFTGLLATVCILRDRAEKAACERAAAASAEADHQADLASDAAAACEHQAAHWERCAVEVQNELRDLYYDATNSVSGTAVTSISHDSLIRHDTEYLNAYSASNAYFQARAKPYQDDANQAFARSADFRLKARYDGDAHKAGIALAIVCPVLLILAWIIHSPQPAARHLKQ